jgi:hypothetical protein
MISVCIQDKIGHLKARKKRHVSFLACGSQNATTIASQDAQIL